MIGALAGIIVVCLIIGAGVAVLGVAMTAIIGLLNVLIGLLQILGEGSVWLTLWLLEFDSRKTWNPWQHWHVGFDGHIDVVARYEKWRKDRQWARTCIYCHGRKRTKLFHEHYAHEVCERHCA